MPPRTSSLADRKSQDNGTAIELFRSAFRVATNKNVFVVVLNGNFVLETSSSASGLTWNTPLSDRSSKIDEKTSLEESSRFVMRPDKNSQNFWAIS